MEDAKLVPKNLGALFVISIFIGLIAGLFSWLFRLLIGLVHNLAFLGQLSPQYDANIHTPPSYLGWLIIFVPVLGGLIVVYLIRNFAPQAKGHGVPEVMNAIYHERGLIPGNVSVVKAFASAITIGTGGSLGREGPIVQISAAFSSVVGKLLRVPVNQRNLFIACGASSGIAATFNAPLGGILFSIELLLVTVNSRTILPVAISTVVAANVGRYLIGSDPAFTIPALEQIQATSGALMTVLAIVLGALVGLLSLVFIRGIYFSEDFFDKLPVNAYLKHIIGSLLLGIMFYAMYLHSGHYHIQGVGYASIQDVLWNSITDPWFLLLLLVTKLLATSLTIGSGGSGGVFSPSLFLGAVAGGFFGNLVALVFPDLGISPIIFVLSGMAAMVAGTTSAPLTAAIIVYEMTLDYGAILPIMAAVGVSYAVRRHFSVDDIYTLKLTRRGKYIPEGLTTDLKSFIRLKNVMYTKLSFLGEDDQVGEDDEVVCVLADGKVCGVIDLHSYDLKGDRPVKELTHRSFIVLNADMTVSQAIEELKDSHSGVAVISSSGELDPESVEGVVTSMHLIKVIGDTTRILRM